MCLRHLLCKIYAYLPPAIPYNPPDCRDLISFQDPLPCKASSCVDCIRVLRFCILYRRHLAPAQYFVCHVQVLEVQGGLSAALYTTFNGKGQVLSLMEDADQACRRRELHASLAVLKVARSELTAHV